MRDVRDSAERRLQCLGLLRESSAQPSIPGGGSGVTRSVSLGNYGRGTSSPRHREQVAHGENRRTSSHVPVRRTWAHLHWKQEISIASSSSVVLGSAGLVLFEFVIQPIFLNISQSKLNI